MVKSYIKIAWRYLWKDKFYSIVTIFGLTISATAFMLLLSYVRYERSYESMHHNAANIVRLSTDNYKGNTFLVSDCGTYPPMGPLLKDQMPEVLNYVRLQSFVNVAELGYNNKALHINKAYAADPSLFSVFDYELIEGSKSTALTEPNEVVITQHVAKRLSSAGEHLMGKTVQVNGKPFVIAGILKDMPSNTHLKFDLLVPFTNIEDWGFNLNSWNGNNNYTYLQLRPGSDLKTLNSKLKQLSKIRLQNQINVVEPIQSIHLHSRKTFEPDINGDARTVNFILIIAFLILIVGMANYVNLVIVQLIERYKEVGLRKVLGSSRSSLLQQYLLESLLVHFFAFSVAVLITLIVLPYCSDLFGSSFAQTLSKSPLFWCYFSALFCASWAVSATYPAWLFSSTKAITATVRESTGGVKALLFKKALVVCQFALASIVLCASIIVNKQMRFLFNQDKGMNLEQVLIVRTPTLDRYSDDSGIDHTFRDKALQIPGISRVSQTEYIPGGDFNEINSTTGIRRYGSQLLSRDHFYLFGTDPNYVPLMEIKLLAGRNFEPGNVRNDEVLINKEAASRFGFGKPEDAIGERITLNVHTMKYGDYAAIVGVMENYHLRSLKEQSLPVITWNSFKQAEMRYYAIKIQPEKVHASIASLGAIWGKTYPGHPFSYYFLDEMFNQQYESDLRFEKIINVFTIFIFLLSAIGMLGLTLQRIRKRSKEVSIRKVLGASIAAIVILLTKEFVILVLIALAIGFPVTIYVMNGWLADFAYRTDMEWWIFAITALCALLIAILIVAFQAARAALTNPVKNLNAE